jgi:uncharacterized membrane protein HdeD (DUF308 family)
MAQQWSDRLAAAGAPGMSPLIGGLELTERDVRRTRNVLVVTGILAILGGAAAIAVPAVGSVTMTIFIGWLLIFYGIVVGIDAMSRPAEERSWMRLLNPLLSVLVGIYLVALPLSGTVTLTFLLAVWFLGSGFFLLLGAFGARGIPGAWMVALHGALSVVLGILIAVNLPSSSDWAIGLLVGINLVFWGIRALMAAGLLSSALRT